MNTSAIQQSNDPVFNYYNRDGSVWILTTKYGILASLCLLGILLNSAMVYVTIKTKSMHTRCNVLIALNSLFYIPLLAGMCAKYVLLQIGLIFIPLLTCYQIQFIPLLSTTLGTTMQFCIGADRLLSVLFPIWYMKSDRHKSFIFLLTICFCRAAWVNYLFNLAANLHPERPVMCSTAELVQPEIAAQVQISSTVLNLLILFCYALIWLVVVRKGNKIDLNKKRMIRSLTIIIGVVLFGYLQTTAWRALLAFVQFDAVNVENWVIYPTLCLYVIGTSSNAPVLFISSYEYRRAFKCNFAHLFGTSNAAQASQPVLRTTIIANNKNNNNCLNSVPMPKDGIAERQHNIPTTFVTTRQLLEARNANFCK